MVRRFTMKRIQMVRRNSAAPTMMSTAKTFS